MNQEKSDGLTDEERAWYDAQEPGPSLAEEYRHPLTGELIIEAGPDTPETRAMKAEVNEWAMKEGKTKLYNLPVSPTL
jgi:hypothetical protein